MSTLKKGDRAIFDLVVMVDDVTENGSVYAHSIYNKPHQPGPDWYPADRLRASVVIDGHDTPLDECINEVDSEECDACDAGEDPCTYHRGVAAGIGMMSSALAFLASDPEVAMETAARVQRLRDDLRASVLSS